jgi:tripartite-type tricarboxylate transporter receptor subunit TctC
MQSIRRATLLSIGLWSLSPLTTWAQTAPYPSKPIRVVVPFAAGSTTDIIARAIADKMSQSLGQPLVIDNKAGASGTIGQAAVASATPDGYTIMIHSSSHTVSPSTFKTLPFDTVNGFMGITPIANIPNLLVVPTASKFFTVKELVNAAKAKPGSLNYASAGTGSATHLNAEKFKAAAQFFAVHIPYTGSAGAITDLMAQRVDYYFSPAAAAIPFINMNLLRPLAVGSGKRIAILPNVPTTAEAGVKDSEFNFWIGMMAPAKTPPEIIKKLNSEVIKALSTPEVKERFSRLGADAWTMPTDQFDDYLKAEIRSNTALVKAARLEVQ